MAFDANKDVRLCGDGDVVLDRDDDLVEMSGASDSGQHILVWKNWLMIQEMIYGIKLKQMK